MVYQEMTFEDIKKEMRDKSKKTDWKKLHAEAIDLLNNMTETERCQFIRQGGWSLIEELSMHVLYGKGDEISANYTNN